MKSTRPIVIAVGLVLSGQHVFAQDSGQHWGAARLAAVAAYAAWVVAQDQR